MRGRATRKNGKEKREKNTNHKLGKKDEAKYIVKYPLTVNVYIQSQNPEVEVTHCTALWETLAQNKCHKKGQDALSMEKKSSFAHVFSHASESSNTVHPNCMRSY